MALKSSLRFVSRKIAEAVELAARNQGVKKDEYFLLGSYSEESDHVYLLLKVAKPIHAAQPIDELRLYKETFEELRRLFPDDPSITMQIGMVIRQVPSVKEYHEGNYGDSAGPDDDFDITDLLERAAAR